ncbi:MAG: BrnT family toxin, partial [Pseudomonadales bacterium]|nr:BrnT family toxin [Pseudomonadales bacterium]
VIAYLLAKPSFLAIFSSQNALIAAQCVSHVYYYLYCQQRVYQKVRYIWDEAKRQSNLKKHGLDFADAEQVFNNPLVTFEDNRMAYGEQRMIALGLLKALIVVVVHVEDDQTIRIISMRKANRHESNLYYQNL